MSSTIKQVSVGKVRFPTMLKISLIHFFVVKGLHRYPVLSASRRGRSLLACSAANVARLIIMVSKP
jgi:hypothetical protein